MPIRDLRTGKLRNTDAAQSKALERKRRRIEAEKIGKSISSSEDEEEEETDMKMQDSVEDGFDSDEAAYTNGDDESRVQDSATNQQAVEILSLQEQRAVIAEEKEALSQFAAEVGVPRKLLHFVTCIIPSMSFSVH